MRINVTLTGSENSYLEYPVYGSLEITEMATDDYIICATFLQISQDGNPVGTRVSVKSPVFEYRHRPA